MLARTMGICVLVLTMAPAFGAHAAPSEPYSITYARQSGPWFYTSANLTHDGLVSLYTQEAFYEGYIERRTVEKLRTLLLDKRFSEYRSMEITHTDPEILCLQYTSGQHVVENCFVENGPEQPELPENIVEAKQILSSVLSSFYRGRPTMRLELAVDEVIVGPKKVTARLSIQNAGTAPVSVPLAEFKVTMRAGYKDHPLQPEFTNDHMILMPEKTFTATFSGLRDASQPYDRISAYFSGEVVSLDKHRAKKLRSRTSKELDGKSSAVTD